MTLTLQTQKKVSAWAPLRNRIFLALWVATIVSNIGTWAQEAGGPWLMKILTHGSANSPVMIALVSVAEYLPMCLLSLVAGALADVLDRRRLLIFTQLWMLAAAGLLGVLTFYSLVGAWVLLLFTFLLGIGIALSQAPFNALLPELVAKEQISLAMGLNSVALNLARAVGPALGAGVIVLAARSVGEARGTSASFMLNAATFIGVAWALYAWKRPPQRASMHAEQLWGAVRLGVRYTRYSPPLRAIMIRVFVFIFCAVAMWAQMPTIAARLHLGVTGYAILMSCLGVGAVVGVQFMPALQQRLGVDGMVTLCIALFALGMFGLALARTPWVAYPIMLVTGFNWVIIPTNFNVATQKSVPPWVKGRALGVYATTLFGTWAVGSFFWGWVTKASGHGDVSWGIAHSLLYASAGLALGLLLVKRYPLTLAASYDLTPAAPVNTALPPGVSPSEGPVLLTVRYRVPAQRRDGFADLLRDLRLQRLRNGAAGWGLENAPSDAGGHVAFAERITFASWQEYSRHGSRATRWDLMLEGLAREYHVGTEPPAVVPTRKIRSVFPPVPFLSRTGYWPADAARSAGTEAAEKWVQDHADRAVDRVIEELFKTYDRVTGRPARQTACRSVTLKLPVSVRSATRAPSTPDRA